MNNEEKHCKIHFMKALSGDCFLIELEDKQSILIDCGYKSTYENELKSLLVKLREEGGRISLFVVTHMDEDHIGGAITFLEENGYRENAQIIDIDNIWFNGLFEICCNEKVVLGHLREQLEKKVDEKNQYIQTQLEKLISCGDGFISAKHAQNFEIVCKEYHYNLNRGLGNGLIQEGQELQIGDCKIKVLSPGKERINNFAKWIDKNLIDCLGDNYQLKKNRFS